MAGIYHPSRGGVRGGKDQFNWDDVKGDKERENYLGHSVMAPTGKWQEGKDLIWYTRDNKLQGESEKELKKKKELKTVKDLEARAMAAALGHKSFTTGTTSLTAKELQEVLSRGKTDHTEGERVQGVGHKKSSTGKSQKSGMTFQGFDSAQKREEDSNENISKKKKKKKEKKKKHKKEKEVSEDSSESDYEKQMKRHRHQHTDGDRKPSRSDDKYKRTSQQHRHHNDDYDRSRRSDVHREERSRDSLHHRGRERNNDRHRHRSRSRSNERPRNFRQHNEDKRSRR